MSKLTNILDLLQNYKQDKEQFLCNCIQKRLDDSLKVYENDLEQAVKHLTLYRKDVVVLNKYSKNYKND